MKEEQDRKYRLETARVTSLRLVSAKPARGARAIDTMENAREVILKLIEAIKKL